MSSLVTHPLKKDTSVTIPQPENFTSLQMSPLQKINFFFPKSSLQGEISMMEDSLCESFEPLDLPHVSTHGDEEPVSVPASVTHNFPQFPKVYSRECS